MGYVNLNSIQASFHQGYVNIFGATSGSQYSCIALYAIVFSSFKDILRWQQEDLNLPLFLGDELHKSLNTQQYLSATDLPTNISVCNVQVQASHLHNNYGMLLNNEDSQNYLTHCLSIHSRESTGSILSITGLCIAVIPCGRDTVFLFDSHSRNREGRPDPNGYFVLLKFSDLVAVANYVIPCYCQGNVGQFEVQFIPVHLEQFSISFSSRLVRNVNNQIQNLNFPPVFAINQIENVKPSKIRKINLNFNCKKSHCIGDHTCVNKFLKMIKQGPFYFCCFCKRCLYRSNVKVFKAKK